MRADLIGHPRAPALSDVQRLKTPTVDLGLEAVISGAVHPHRPARRRNIPELIGQREQPQAKSEQHVMLCHRLLLLCLATESLSRHADGPGTAVPGPSDIKPLPTSQVLRELGVSPG